MIRILPDLERTHHSIAEIATRGGRIPAGDLSPRARELAGRMSTLASAMWRLAADSWYQRDAAAAPVLAQQDEEMGILHDALTDELATGRMPTPVTMDMTLVARFYARAADHAVNVTRRVTYLAGTRPAKDQQQPG